MPRPIWSGSISFGLVDIPVTLHSAQTRNDLSFHLLDQRDMARVGYQKINKETGKTIPADEIVRAYEYEKDNFVVLDDEDFERADIEATKTIEIENFVEADSIPIEFFEKPYYLAPQRRKNKGYALLRETLKETSLVGVSRIVIRAREHLAAIMERGEVLVLEIMRYEHELRDFDDLDLPSTDLRKLKIKQKEVDMAKKLMQEMIIDWDASRYQDEYRADLLEVIEKKAKAGDTEAVEEIEAPKKDKKRANVVDIMDLLEKSVNKRSGKKTKKKSSAKKKTNSKRKQA
ncbi:MAG TPA: Ku protein [Gammaproteobacteria bacterium]|nr:Ku protein [Gammaproteobacteria bacterium]